MGEQRRRRLDTRSWREVMLRFGEADMTVSAFCAREGLSTSSFYRWRERLGSAGDAEVAVPHRGGRSELAVPPQTAGFIDLGHLATPPRDAGAGVELRLDLGGGVVLQIVRR
jgi:putative transposase